MEAAPCAVFPFFFLFLSFSGHVQEVELDEEVDVIVSEWMGYMLLYEVSTSCKY